MTLSGYLFAKLLDGKRPLYLPFLWNRVVRLGPLLVLVFFVSGVLFVQSGGAIGEYLWRLARGFILPSWPNGGWSIIVEFHFYLILPIILYFTRMRSYAPLVFLVMAIGVRYLYWTTFGEVQRIGYWTIAGCIDQFLMGIFAYIARDYIRKRHFITGAVVLGFIIYVYLFDRAGGFYVHGNYPSGSPIWIIHPTVLGLAFGWLTAWYDNSFTPKASGLSLHIARIGECSYSFYLLHFFYYKKASWFVNDNIIELDGGIVTFLAAVVCFLIFVPVAWLSYRFIEMPLMRFRRPYTTKNPTPAQ